MAVLPIEKRIEELITPSVNSMGYEIVRVKLGEGKGNALQIMAERADGGGFGLEDCSKVSKTVSALLDVEDIIADSYNLEVSSPGLERPLLKLKDFEKYSGRNAKVTLKQQIDGRKRFSGSIQNVEESEITLKLLDADEEIKFSVEDIDSAKLLIGDEIFKR